MLRTMERPTNTTLRPYLWAASTTCCTRCTWLEKLATMILRVACANAWSSAGPMEVSGLTKPGTSALVESIIRRSTPFSPSLPNSTRSVMRWSSGSWSSLMSPVSISEPAGVCTNTASASGMECVTFTNSRLNGPTLSLSRPLTSTSVGLMRCSLHLASTKARVSLEPISGMSGRSLSRYGTPPMWSSWPWVSTSASTLSRRSLM